MASRGFIYLDAPPRFLPLDGTPAILLATGGSTYPVSYGAIGSYRPSDATTGPPAGTTLTVQTGDVVVNTAGTVLDGLDIHGKVTIRAANVTIQRSIVRGSASFTNINTSAIDCTNAGCVNALIQDVAILPQTPSLWQNGINGHDFTALRVEIRDVVDYFGTYPSSASISALNVRIEQCWGHSMAYFTPDPNHADSQTHNDGNQIQGGHGSILRGNSFESYYGTAGSSQPTNTGATPVAANPSLSCILFNNNVGTTGDHIVEDNWFMGAYVPINCGGAPGVNLGRMWRNRFGNDSLVTGGVAHTIDLRADQTCDTGDGTAYQNVFNDTGLPVTVRHNA
jgi:hypothetical protein